MPAVLGAVTALALVPPPAAADEPCVGTDRDPAATHCVKLPVERDTIIMSAHDANNDGSWGYGWIKVAQGTNRGLLGVDLTPVKDFTITGARLILWVAKNNFRVQNKGGTPVALHAFDPINRAHQWAEGDDRWDQFNICSQTKWVRPAVHVPDYPGATWLCAADPSTSDNFLTDCGSSLAWDPGPQYLNKLQKEFVIAPAGVSPEASDDCDYPALNPSQATTPKSDCDPTCLSSVNCFKAQVAQPDPSLADPSQCFRRVVIDLYQSEIDRLNDKLDDVPMLCTGGLGIKECPELHPSWLLKRLDEQQSQGGGFHYFSREGAVCILGDKNPSFSGGYAKLVPTLEVDIIVPEGQQAPSDPEPVAHCDQYCEGPLPASGRCSFTAYNPMPPEFPNGSCDEEYYEPGDENYVDYECRFPCKQGSCKETVVEGQDRCDCLPG